MSKKKPADTFTSIRILGKKAQELLLRARKNDADDDEPRAEPVPIPASPSEPGKRVAFSPGSIAQATLVVLAICLGGWMLFMLKDKILMLLLAFFVASIMDPGVTLMEKWNIPRGVGILIHYAIALCLFIFLLVSLIPIIAEQLQQIALLISAQVDSFVANPQIHLPLLDAQINERLTELAKSTLENLSIDRFTDTLQSLGQGLGAFAGGSFLVAAQIGLSVVEFFVRLIIVLVLAFFIQIEKEHIRTWFRSFFPPHYRRYLDSKAEAMNMKIGKWARGQLLLALCIGLLSFLALVILGIPYAITLGVLAAFTEFIPYVGPLIAAVPAVLIALTQGGFLWALVVAGVYYAIQWCENNLLVPLIMKRAVGLSPIAIIFAMLVGVSFPGIVHPILGILLAVPATTIITLFLEDWREMRQKAR